MTQNFSDDDDFLTFDFTPDFAGEDNNEIPAIPREAVNKLPTPASNVVHPTTVENDERGSVTLSNLVDMTKDHIKDDTRVRKEIEELVGYIDTQLYQMTPNELINYYKAKLKEREFHVKSIFDAYNFVQRMEFAREMLVGNDRKERVTKALGNQRLTRIMGYLNMNNKQD
jgi:hypothetical protein